jgi:hypothetical protein
LKKTIFAFLQTPLTGRVNALTIFSEKSSQKEISIKNKMLYEALFLQESCIQRNVFFICLFFFSNSV